MITVTQGDPRDPQATALLQASHALMQELFPAESNHFLGIDALCQPEIAFFVAKTGDDIIATGALANKGEYGEIKSMFTAPAARGTGAATKILSEIETHARAQNLPHLMLETGNSLHAAHRLYERAGFTRRGRFGDYPEDPLSIFMEKPLT